MLCSKVARSLSSSSSSRLRSWSPTERYLNAAQGKKRFKMQGKRFKVLWRHQRGKKQTQNYIGVYFMCTVCKRCSSGVSQFGINTVNLSTVSTQTRTYDFRMWHHLQEPFDHLLGSLVHAHPLALQHDGVQEGVLPELQLVPQRGALFAWTHSTRSSFTGSHHWHQQRGKRHMHHSETQHGITMHQKRGQRSNRARCITLIFSLHKGFRGCFKCSHLLKGMPVEGRSL